MNMLASLPENPLVTVFVNCKNGQATVRKCIESVLDQRYQNVELLFHDGGSSDGSVNIAEEYRGRHPQRVIINQEADSNPAVGLFRAIKACRGDIIGSCMADEALHPHAVEVAVKEFKATPEVGAIYGDAQVVDDSGDAIDRFSGHPFSLERYLLREIDQPFVSSFFRRDALLKVGLMTRDWRLNIGEFELWLRLGLDFPIRHVPGIIADYGVSPRTLSSVDFDNDGAFVASRSAFFDAFFSEPDLPVSIASKKAEAMAGLHLFIAERLLDKGQRERVERHLAKAMAYRPNAERLLHVARTLYDGGGVWNFPRLKTHIANFLGKLQPSRIACFGAGNDFARLMAAGAFSRHEIVAAIDNVRPEGSTAAGVPVIGIERIRDMQLDAIVVTSSRWGHPLRRQALEWAARHSPRTLVI
jgi:glycosyltransferase involved in cell wall biosynthesis